MMFIENKYNLGDIVYLITDEEQKKRLITSIKINPNGIIYELTQSTVAEWYYDMEFSSERDIIMVTNN